VSARPPLIAVCGASDARADERRVATEVGTLLVGRGAVIVCGGVGGVMAAVAGAVRRAGGTCVGLLPGADAADANADVTIALPTGLGEMRNALIARCCDGMIAVGGGYGTLSEIGFALRIGKPVVTLGSWDVHRPGDTGTDPAPHPAGTAADAVDWIMQRVLAR